MSNELTESTEEVIMVTLHTKRDDPRVRPTIKCGPGKTQQNFKDQVDINRIMKKYEKTGDLPQTASAIPQYGDYSNVTDYKTAVDRVNQAYSTFMELPAHIRAHVNNNPGDFIAFVENPDNIEKMHEFGLLDEESLVFTPDTPIPAPIPEKAATPEGETPPD